jgi:hypothetical protein
MTGASSGMGGVPLRACEARSLWLVEIVDEKEIFYE